MICRSFLQIAVALLRQGDAWTFEIARNRMFSRRKFPASMWETLCLCDGRGLRSGASATVK